MKLVSHPDDVLDFDIHDFLSEEEIAEACAPRILSDEDAAFWTSLSSKKYFEALYE